YGHCTVDNLNSSLYYATPEGESIRILKFPSADHVRKWLTDPRYLETVPLRERGYRQVTITLLEE
ncbi:DUF1330 domain-containing protein, partial [Fischerella thermalis]|uniref:DUF1330 domain-containing protein n=1 Tax=Fischerella thermalis TaxID=372787 RepID=UPI001A0F9E1C